MQARHAEHAATATVTTTEAAVLALLAIEGRRSAYALEKLVRRAIGHVWSPARSGLFATLPRLAARGLLATHAGAGRPVLYEVTETGREALRAWLERVDEGAREPFFLRLFVGGLTTPAVLVEHVERFRADVAGRLAVLRAIEPTNTGVGHDWYHRHVLVYAIRRAELELEWADEVAQALRERAA
jgi:DNA-binding PadR family transcriptional regulator